jgi:hypothetical protein
MAVPGFSGLTVVSLFQSFLLMDIWYILTSIFKLSIKLTNLQIIVPMSLILLWNYLWLYKINSVKDVFSEVENLPHSKAEFYRLAIVIHFMLCIGLFVLAISIRNNK